MSTRRAARGRAPRRGTPSSRRPDAGQASHLEAIAVAAILFTGLASAEVILNLTAGNASAPHAAAQHAVSVQLRDALQALEHLSTTDAYHDVLNRVLARAYQGNTTELDTLLHRALPEGAGYRVVLDNGHAKRILAGPEEFIARREQVAVEVLYHPEWDYTTLVPGYDVVPPGVAMPVQGYAVAQGALVQEGGVPVNVTLTTQDATGNTATYHAGFVTSLRNASSAYLTLQGSDGLEGYNWSEPSVLPNVTLPLYHDAENGVPVPGSFTVDPGTLALNVNATASGLGASYTLVMTPPGKSGVSYTVSDTSPLRVVVTAPGNGTWMLNATAGPVPVSGSTVDITALMPRYNADWNVTVHETAGQNLTEGTKLAVVFPAPFAARDLQNASQTGWRSVNATVAPDGGVIVTAELDSVLNNATRTFTAHADRGLTASSALYVVRAYLGNGSVSSASTFIIGNALGVSTVMSNPVQHTFYASAAKPLAPGKESQWGFTFAYPALANSQVATETLLRMDVTVQKDQFDTTRDIFAFFGPGSDPANQGWHYDSATHVWWTPPQGTGAGNVPPNGDYQILFPFTTLPTEDTSTEPSMRMPLTFENDFTGTAYDQVQPFIFSDAYPPEVPPGSGQGYPSDTFRNSTVNVTAAVYARSSLAYGSAQFNTSVLASLGTYSDALRLGLLQSSVLLSKQKVRLGESVNVTVDFTGLLSRLAMNASAWSIEAGVYDPAQPFLPFAAWSPVQDVVVRPDPLSVGAGVMQFDFTPSRDAFYGPYATVAQGHLQLTGQLGVPVNVTARLLSVVNVVPDGGQAESALYWVILEAWMPDWT